METPIPGIAWFVIYAAVFVAAVYITRAIFSIPELVRLQREQLELLKKIYGQSTSQLPNAEDVETFNTGDRSLDLALQDQLIEAKRRYRIREMTEEEFNAEKARLRAVKM